MKLIIFITVFLGLASTLAAQKVLTDTLFAADLSGADSTYFFEMDKHTGKAFFVYFDKVQQNDGVVKFGLSIDEKFCALIDTAALNKLSTTHRAIDNGYTSFVVPFVLYDYWPAKCKACLRWVVGSETDTLIIKR